MSKNQNHPLSLNDIESIKNRDLQSVTPATLNELNDVTGGQPPLPNSRPLSDYAPPLPDQQFYQLGQHIALIIASTIGL